MAKPKAKAKKRKERVAEIAELVKPQSAKKLERALTAYVDAQDEESQKREDWVRMILSVNDETIEIIVNAMVDSFWRMATGISKQDNPLIYYNGSRYNPRNDAERDLLLAIARRNRRWMAVRILVASAEQDIQIGNFKLPKGKCARCGKKPVKPTKPVKVVAKAKKKISKPSKKVKK